MSNPHLRARLAEVLEALLPPADPMDSEPATAQPAPSFARARAFSQFAHPAALTRALLLVFVDIEFTGEQMVLFLGYNVKARGGVASQNGS